MKIQNAVWIVFFLLVSNSAHASPPTHDKGFEGAPSDLFSVRVNSLNVLTQKILPEVIFQQHLNHEKLPDQTLYHTKKFGYDVSVDLKNITIQLPEGSKNHVDGAFGVNNQFLMNLLIPQIFATSDVAISLIPSHSWEPKIIKKFKLKVTGFSAAGSITLGAQDGDLIATTYDITQTEVSRVDIEDLGLLKEVLNEWVSLTEACQDALQDAGQDASKDAGNNGRKATCNTFDDYLTLKANLYLTSVIKDQIMGTMKDSLIGKLKAAATASFSFDQMNMDFALKLDNFRTENNANHNGASSSGVFDWKIWTKSSLSVDPCAAKLPLPVDSGAHFKWPSETHGDLELALSPTFFEQILYSVGEQGLLCGNVKGSVAGFIDYQVKSGPGGPLKIQIQEDSQGAISASANGSMYLNIYSLPGALIPVHSDHSSFQASVSLIPSVEEKEVILKYDSSSVSNVKGDIDVTLFPIPMSSLKGEIKGDLATLLKQNLATLNIIHREIDINQFMKARVQKDLRVHDGQLLMGIEFVPGETTE